MICLTAVAAIILVFCTGGCSNGSGGTEPDAQTMNTANRLSQKMEGRARLTQEEFDLLKTSHEKYPQADSISAVYQQALTQREDWASLEKLLGSRSDNGSEEDLTLLAKVYMKLGKYSEAVETFTKLTSPPDAERASMLASAYFQTGNHEKAAETLDSKWSEIVDRKMVDGMVLRGLLYFYGGENEKAIEILKSVVENDPSSIPAHNALSRIYAKMNDSEQATFHSKAVEDAYKKLTEKSSRQGRMVDQMIRLQEAYKAGRHAEVVEIANGLLDSADPRNKVALYGFLYNSYRALGMNDKAQEARIRAQQISGK
ncbi:MAG: hypothetical protein DWQ47_14675 [Acidobacteria bacterium]|nr:MAG: hypothetical protein DWQ32_02075 [Acidobacteriota bacterium]REK02689.1 MAG: hypothetical protein DWQ38_10060 [Acidobacteriota bacterium]REK13506.1 MAG: hypothetical protein DWQ43_07765 [Acidobacteriota bacterium]REK41500.1 MAG: hypothetical protein DWQ47_14675 [Acidobacteriota bacterium]